MKGKISYISRLKSGVNTANLPVLTNEEMQKLFVKIKAGDMKAREELYKVI